MEKKKIIIITVDDKAGQLYKKTLEEIWGQDTVEIGLYHRESFLEEKIIPSADLYVASKGNIEYLLGAFEHKLPLGTPMVDIRVTFKREALETLSELPDNTHCMFVNASEPLALECIVDLYRNSMYNLHLVPFWPEKEVPLDIDVAITSGGCELVPAHVKKVYDLGIRHLTPRTIVEICLALNMGYVLETDSYFRYLEQFSLTEQSFRRPIRNSHYYKASAEILIETSNDAIVGINEDQRVFCINRNALSLFHLQKEECMGQSYKSVLPFLEYDEFAYISEAGDSSQKLYDYEGTLLDAFVHTIEDNGEFRGLMVRMQRYVDKEDQLQDTRRKLLNKGHGAKYTFDDIITTNPAMQSLCQMAARIAETKSAVLITGESGTGKELLASAIHNASSRVQNPYVAINCAAIPEHLLESELFGYDEGAFTGAKKSGKPGLFEQAHRGTLFLDEIENMSPMLQVKLLRVLQEKEVMRVGGSKLISVDVRIIAATNEDMERMVQGGEFRKDLYYRLNTMELHIPPLRERKEDIPLLLEHFKKVENFDFTFSHEVMDCFFDHSWDGNVRELRNCVEYLQCVNKQVIQVRDLPIQFSNITRQYAADFMGRPDLLKLSEDEKFVLQCLFESHNLQVHVGRRLISERAGMENRNLSEQMVRRILKKLEKKGLVYVERGRAGSRVTRNGIQYCERNFTPEK